MCAPSTPSKTTQTADLPDWAKGYAQDTLAKGAALTDLTQNPYKTYDADRIAGFQPLQEQAFKTAGNLDAGPEAFAKGIGSYMSPYMQNVVDIEKREARRQSGIAGTQQQAQATQAGAFGGGRDAIMRAERERNLAEQMGDIQSKGSQAAYEQAGNQFRQGITQQSGLATQQATLGQAQQQQEQRPLDVAYQDFVNQQNYPYKQLGYMSDLIRGLPLGQKSSAQTYEGSGSTVGQLAGLGMGALGLSRMMSDGGVAYAEGGLTYANGGVTDPQNIEAILAKLSDLQLKQAHDAAMDRRDMNEVQMIEAVMAQRAAMRQGTQQIPEGIAPAVTDQFADDMEQSMATGGIVAFADRGAVKEMPEKETSPIGDIWEAIGGKDAVNAIREHYYKSKEDEKRIEAAESLYPGVTESLRPSERTRRKTAADTLFKGPKDVKTLSDAEIEAASKANTPVSTKAQVQAQIENPISVSPVKKTADKSSVQATDQTPGKKASISNALPQPTKAEIKSAVEQLAEKNGLGTDEKDNLMSITAQIRKEQRSENQPLIDEMRKMSEGQKPDVEAMKSQGLSQALAEFGFKMAASAARPGARFLESASSAAPSLSAAAAKTQELVTAAQQNYAKLKMDQTKYEVALAKADMQTAATLAGQIRQGQQQEKLLQFNIAKSKDDMALEQQKLAQQAQLEREKLASQNAYQSASLSRYETVGSLTKQIMQNEGLPYGQALDKAGNILRGGIPAGIRSEASLAAAKSKAIEKAQASPIGTLLAMTPPTDPKYAMYKTKFNEMVQQQMELLSPGSAQLSGQSSAAPARIKLNQNGEIIQ